MSKLNKKPQETQNRWICFCVTPTTFLEKRIGSCIANTAFKVLDSWTSLYQVQGMEVYLPKTWLHINTWSHIKRSLKNGDPQ